MRCKSVLFFLWLPETTVSGCWGLILALGQCLIAAELCFPTLMVCMATEMKWPLLQLNLMLSPVPRLRYLVVGMCLSSFCLVSKLQFCCWGGLAQMGLVLRCLFALVFLFRGRKGSSVLIVSLWLLRFQVNSWIVISLLSIEPQVRMTESDHVSGLD